ncbi:MAG: DUF547 domain-containing protein [Planctomycetota bacterium]
MRKLPILGFATLLIAAQPMRAWAGPKVHVGANVAVGSQVSIDQISHSSWDALLRKYCDQRGFVNYRAWHDSTTDMRLLEEYLVQLSHANPALSASRASQFAFWINAYNAVTVRGILREYPTTSIRNHTAKVVGYNIWHDLLLPVGGQDFSLDQIEHKVLRPMGDPRIHFAIVCASIGCPPLLNRAYTAQELDAQLSYSAKQFFADPEKFAATSRGELKLSQILQWFPKDFGPDQAALLRRIAPFLPTREAQALASSGRARVSYLEYDWGLNDQAALSN